MTAKAWNSVKSITSQKIWNELLGKQGVKNVQNDVQLISKTKITIIITEIPGISECGNEEVYEWLNTIIDDSGYQIMTNENINGVNKDYEALSHDEESEEDCDDSLPAIKWRER